eukprot:10985064-Lingulodinium_polyedra.AAC.1
MVAFGHALGTLSARTVKYKYSPLPLFAGAAGGHLEGAYLEQGRQMLAMRRELEQQVEQQVEQR